MPSIFIFGRLELKKRSCEIPFLKSIVYSDVVLDKLGLMYTSKIFFLAKNLESQTMTVADGH